MGCSGESTLDVEGKIVGWTDAPLSDKGKKQAVQAGRRLLGQGLRFDVVFTSVLRRAVCTAWTALAESDNFAMPIINTWRLNERHHGSLQGMNAANADARCVDWCVLPPEVGLEDSRHPGNDPL